MSSKTKRKPKPSLTQVAAKSSIGLSEAKGEDTSLDFKALGLLDAAAGPEEPGAGDGGEPSRPVRKGKVYAGPVKLSDLASEAVLKDVTGERKLRTVYSQLLDEWICGDVSRADMGSILYVPDSVTGAAGVDGAYLHRTGFRKWLAGIAGDKHGLRHVAIAQELIDSVLDLSGIFDENRVACSLPISNLEDIDSATSSLKEAVSMIYDSLGIMSVAVSDDGAVSLEVDVSELLAAFQVLSACLLSWRSSRNELVCIAKSIDSALVDADRKRRDAEGKLESAERKVSQLKSSLDNRPTKGDLDRANARIAELEAQLDALRAQQGIRDQEVAAHEAQMVQIARQQARQEVAGQIDELVRSQAETERRARDAEASLEAAYSKLDTAERRRSENQRIHDAEVRSLKQALAAAGTGSQSESPCFPASEIAELPQTAASVLELAARAFSDKLVVLDSAYDSADDYKGDPYEVWTMMRALATDGYDLYLGEHSYDVRAEFRNRTGIELSTTEPSMGTKEDKKAWETTYNGKSYSLCNHIKGSKRKNYDSLRIHFAVDRDDRILIVAHCGDHLPSGATRRRGW